MSKGKFSKADRQNLLKETGRLITLHRNLKGYTILVLATKCNMEYNQLCEIESGEINATIKNIMEITNQLDINIQELFI